MTIIIKFQGKFSRPNHLTANCSLLRANLACFLFRRIALFHCVAFLNSAALEWISLRQNWNQSSHAGDQYPTFKPLNCHDDGFGHQDNSETCVRQADDIEHTLDKGLWVGTGAT